MKLYMFEHCSLCFRVRMMAALKRLPLQETVVRDDDSDTMVGLVGKRVIPILVKDDGKPMLESMDMVKYIEGLGPPVLVGPQRTEIAAWADADRTEDGAADHAALSAARPARIRHAGRARALHRAQVQDLRRFRRAAQPHARADRSGRAEARRARRPDRKPAGGQRHAVARRHPRAAAAAFGRGGQRPDVPAPGARLLRNHDAPHRLQAACRRSESAEVVS